jgi:uncharacterized membrane protein
VRLPPYVASHPAAVEATLPLVGIAIAVVLFYYFIRWKRHTFGKLGLSPGEIAVIIWASLVGSLLNIPIAPFGDGFIGINIGGAVVPIVLSAYLIRRKGLPINEVLVGILAVALVSYLVTTYDPEIGVYATFPWYLLPPFTAFLVAAFAFWHQRPHSAALAYVSGVIGTLIGADLFRLPEILAGPAPGAGGILSIGGAGVFDMVFLSGILAVTMESTILARTREDLVTQWGHNPIDAEYQAWVRRKEQESEEARAKYRQIERGRKEDPRTYAQRKLREQTQIRPPTPSPERTSITRTPHRAGGTTRTSIPRSQAYRSRYESRYTRRTERPRYESRYQPRYQKRTATTRTGTRGSGPADKQTQQWRPLETERSPSGASGIKTESQRPPPIEGPRPPPRQPRPASGTRRIPASHRARGLYRRDDS